MPRILIDLPEHFGFSTELPIEAPHINEADHLDNLQLLALVGVARTQFLASMGYHHGNIEGVYFVMGDAAVQYKTEAFLGEVLRIEMTANHFKRCSCDMVYRVTEARTGREVACGKSGLVFFNRDSRQVTPVPPAFRARWA